MIVAKFGGSTIKNADGIKRCAQIVLGHPEICLVVLSATFNTTNLLEEVAHKGPTVFERVKSFHDRLLADLKLPSWFLDHLFCEGEALALASSQESTSGRDRLCAIGERLSTRIFTAYLQKCLNRPVCLVDAREIVITNENFGRAEPLIDEIRIRASEKITPLVEKNCLVVTQGFIGSTLQGETTSLGREGSDFSATLLAEGIGARTVHIWTDVPGIASADPKWVPNGFFIPELSYSLASLMALKGAKILFPDTLEPARRQGLSVFVGSALEPNAGGTWIRPDGRHPDGPLALILDWVNQENRLSLIGKNIEDIIIDLEEVERGEFFRTFRIPGDLSQGRKVLRLIHNLVY